LLQAGRYGCSGEDGKSDEGNAKAGEQFPVAHAVESHQSTAIVEGHEIFENIHAGIVRNVQHPRFGEIESAGARSAGFESVEDYVSRIGGEAQAVRGEVRAGQNSAVFQGDDRGLGFLVLFLFDDHGAIRALQRECTGFHFLKTVRNIESFPGSQIQAETYARQINH